MKKNTGTTKIVDAMKSSKGRWFGLETKQGKVINGRFDHESPNYVFIEDRNLLDEEVCPIRQIHKNSIKRLRVNGEQILV